MSNSQNKIDDSNLTNETLTCRDCGNLFLFTAAEQSQYIEKGLKHKPSRCPICRKKNREAVESTLIPVQCRMCKKRGLTLEVPEGQVDTLCEKCFLRVKTLWLAKHPRPSEV